MGRWCLGECGRKGWRISNVKLKHTIISMCADCNVCRKYLHSRSDRTIAMLLSSVTVPWKPNKIVLCIARPNTYYKNGRISSAQLTLGSQGHVVIWDMGRNMILDVRGAPWSTRRNLRDRVLSVNQTHNVTIPGIEPIPQAQWWEASASISAHPDLHHHAYDEWKR